MTIDQPHRPFNNRRVRRRRTARIVLAVGSAAIVLVTAVVAVQLLWPAGPRPLFQLPVPCGETWQLSTYPGHGDYDVDLYPTKGGLWGQPVLASYAGTVSEAGINGSLGSRTPAKPNPQRGRGGAPHLHYEQRQGWQKVETYFDGLPSGITHDDAEYTVELKSNNCVGKQLAER